MVVLRRRRGELVFGPRQPLHEQPRFAALGGRLVAGPRRAGVPAPLPLVLLASAAPGEMAALDEATPLPTRYKVLYRYLTRRSSKGFGGLKRGVEPSGSLVHSFTLGVGGGT